jgi:diguanylate cyclase (GGDEF)-like protein
MTAIEEATTGHPVLIIGAGRGGTALLEMFADDPLIRVIGIVDVAPAATGMTLAAKLGVPSYTDLAAALDTAARHSECIVYNLTHDDSITRQIEQRLGRCSVTSGVEAKLVWQMVTRLKQVQTELRASQEQLAFMAHHDGLTQLPNRVHFLGRLQQALAMADRGGYRVAVLFLDLDGFKPVNDTLGHQAGDELLRQVALRLRAVLREQDALARVGGDEFVFALSNIAWAENAAQVAEKVLTALADPFVVAGQTRCIGGSIGIAFFPDDATQFDALLQMADTAMYEAKRGGKNTYCFYSADVEASLVQRHVCDGSARAIACVAGDAAIHE